MMDVSLPMIPDSLGRTLGSAVALSLALSVALTGGRTVTLPDSLADGRGRSEVVLLPGTGDSSGGVEGAREVSVGGREVTETSTDGVDVSAGSSDSVPLALTVGSKIVGSEVKLGMI